MRMQKFLTVTLFSAMIALVAPAAWAQTAQPVKLRIAAAGLGSSWYVVSSAISELMKPQLPPQSTVDVLPSAGGVGNAILAADGRADLALTHSVVARWALDGTVAFKAKQENLRGIAGAIDKYDMAFVITKKSGITSIEDLKAKKFPLRLTTVDVGGLGELGARHILEAYGLSYDMIKSWGGSVTHTSRQVIVGSIRDGHADAFMHIVTPGHPALSEVVLTTDMRFLPLSEGAVKFLGEKYGWGRGGIPAKTFKGQDEDILTVSAPTVMVASKTVSDNAAYLVTKTLVEQKDKLIQAHAGMKGFDPAQACKKENIWLPLHPGAEKYYKEKGYLK